MQDKDNTLYSLSRRKMLAGIGAVGLASAGAGLGTSALFSDTEEFSGNSITAGTLDMTVTATKVAASPFFADSPIFPVDNTTPDDSVADDTQAAIGFTLDDIKPGDWCIICYDVEVADNPGYLKITTKEMADLDNGHTEPESSVDPNASPDDPGVGELDDAMLASVWYGYDDSNATGKDALVGLDGISNEAGGDDVDLGYAAPDALAYTASNYGAASGNGAQYTTVRELYDFLEAGYVVMAPNESTGPSSPLVIDSDNPDTAAGHVEKFTFYVLYELPAFIGNVVQSDSVSFDICFDTEQIRNNPTPFAAEQTPTPTPTPTTTPTPLN